MNRIYSLVFHMVNGKNIVYMSRDEECATQAFNDVISLCKTFYLPFKAFKTNGQMRITSQGGSIHFVTEREHFRGYSCDTFIIDDTATFKDWTMPLRDIADTCEVMDDEEC